MTLEMALFTNSDWSFSGVMRRSSGKSSFKAGRRDLIPSTTAKVEAEPFFRMVVSTARPQLFFGWIVGLVTVVAAIFPFSTTAALDAKIATGLVNLAIGAVIGILVSGVAARSSR